MLAILSDVHANLEALQAVLADASACGVDDIVCLGDLVGYGPNPVECVELSRSWSVVLKGNWESRLTRDGLTGPALETDAALEACRDALDQSESGKRCREFLESRPVRHAAGSAAFVHGSPRRPLDEYLFPEDVFHARKMAVNFAELTGVCFVGHTHIPGVFVAEVSAGVQDDRWRYHHPSNSPQTGPATLHRLADDKYRWSGQSAICNVGSVGQPRDGDWRASYVLFDGNDIRFRRVEYDIDKSVRKLGRDRS